MLTIMDDPLKVLSKTKQVLKYHITPIDLYLQENVRTELAILKEIL